MSRTAIATWLSRPIMVVSCNPSISSLVGSGQSTPTARPITPRARARGRWASCSTRRRAQRVRLGNPCQRHVWIADQLTAPAHGKRDRNHPGKTEPTAIGNGALLGADDERAVFVKPTGGYLIDLCRVAGCEPQQFTVAA